MCVISLYIKSILSQLASHLHLNLTFTFWVQMKTAEHGNGKVSTKKMN